MRKLEYYRQTKNPKKGLETIKKIRCLCREDSQVSVFEGHFYSDLQRHPEAIKSYQNLVKNKYLKHKMLYLIGRIYIQMGLYKKVLPVCETIITVFRKNLITY